MMALIRFPTLIFALLPLGLLLSCSEVRLHTNPLKIAAAQKGTICTQPPKHLENLNRVLFVTDMSQSMSGVDPHNLFTGSTRRVAGLRQLINQYREDDNFTLALGSLHQDVFGFLPDDQTNPPTLPRLRTTCNFLKPRVDNELQRLNKGLNQMDTLSDPPRGNTPFRAILENSKRCIEEDLNTNTSGRYSVVIVTDGAPTDVTPKQLRDLVTDLVHAGKVNPQDPVESSRVNIFFYFMDNFNGNPDGAHMMQKAVLAAQSAGGYGSRSVVADEAGPVDYKEIGIFSNRRYVMRHMAVVNMNGALGPDGFLDTDSDGDGLTDAQEKTMKLDPLDSSTHQSCSDMVWRKNGGRCPATCMGGMDYLDSDHDGLSDCDDLSLGTNPYHFDRDGDLIFDGLEFRIGSNPLDPRDASADMDTDGLNGFEESMRHTSVFFDDRNVRHGPLVDIRVEEVEPQDGQRCYSIAIKNIPLFPTSAVARETMIPLRHDQGGNVIKLMFFQVTEDNPSAPPVLLYAYKTLYHEDFEGGLGMIKGFSSHEFQTYTPESL